MASDPQLLRRNVIGQRLLRIGGLLLGKPVTNGVAVARAALAEDADHATLAGWVMEEAEKRGVTLSPEYADRIVRLAAARRPARRQSGRLAVVTCHFNPAGYRRLRDNYLRFLHHIRWFGVPVFSAELAFDDQEFPTSDAFLRLRGGPENMMWQKERLINLLVERLPPEYSAVAWVDADVVFADPDWPQRTMQALSEFPVVQLWNSWYCCDAAAAFKERLTSVGRMAANYLTGKPCSPGGAWAARRAVFPLYDAHIVGSGDATSLEGWTDMARPTCLSRMNPAMQSHFKQWAIDAYRKVRGRIGSLEGDVLHMYHGKRANRQYVERWRPLIDGRFDPSQHICKDSNGLYAWTPEAPLPIVEWVANYFRQRQEDD